MVTGRERHTGGRSTSGQSLGIRLSAFLILLGAVGCRTRPQVTDRNGDGHIQLLCVGDSNTDNQGLADQPKWCELLAQRHPEWKVVDGAARFAVAAGDCLLCGRTMLRSGLTSASPDVVLIALGTNDIVSFRKPPEATVDALLALRDQATAANADVYVATIPPAYATYKDGSSPEPQIEATNALLAQRLPANRLMDFHSSLAKEDFAADGIHINRSGQEKLAAAADQALTSR